MIKPIPIPKSTNPDIMQWHMYLCVVNNALSYSSIAIEETKIMKSGLSNKLKEFKASELCKPEKDEIVSMTQVCLDNIDLKLGVNK